MTVRDLDAAGRLSGAAVAVGKYASVARYINAGFDSAVKTWMTRAEVADLRKHRIAIRPTHEIGADDVLAGHTAAVSRARQALADLAELGMPDAVAWWTADRNIVLANKSAVMDYAAGWTSVLGADRSGVYGDYEVLDWVVGGGLARYGWQAGATSWSDDRINSHAHIVQTTERVVVGGVQCDVNEVRDSVTDWGQWPRPVTPDRDEDEMAVHRLYQDPGSPLVVAGGPGYWRGMRSAEERDALAGLAGFGAVVRPNARQWDLLRTTLVRLAPEPQVDEKALAADLVPLLPSGVDPVAVAAAVVSALAARLAATGPTP